MITLFPKIGSAETKVTLVSAEDVFFLKVENVEIFI